VTTDGDRRGVIPSVRLSPSTRALVTGAAVLLLVTLTLNVVAVRYGDGVSRPLLALWTVALTGAGFAAWSVHRQRLAADPHFYERRRLNASAERAERVAGFAVVVVLMPVLLSLELTGLARWVVSLGAVFLASVPVQLLAKRRDPRARLWGRPPPLTDEELAQRGVIDGLPD
jgi:hypothetical protein